MSECVSMCIYVNTFMCENQCMSKLVCVKVLKDNYLTLLGGGVFPPPAMSIQIYFIAWNKLEITNFLRNLMLLTNLCQHLMKLEEQ